MKFQVGDIVQRVNNSYKEIREGDLVMIEKISNERLYLHGHHFFWSTNNFILYDGLEQIVIQMRREIDAQV